MLVGLPGSGKTTWATKYAEEHVEKNYNLIGASSIYERMKVGHFN
jgi:signal recognition particle GTPase